MIENMEQFQEKLQEFKKKCDKPLATGWIKERKGDRNNYVKYLEASYVLRALNYVFTPLGWSRHAESHQIIHEEKTKKGQWKVTAECKMTLTLHPWGTPLASHTDIGIGKSFASDQGVAKSSAIKNAYTDGIKRCGMTLGDFFGLCLKLDEQTATKIGAIEKSGQNPSWVFSDEAPPSPDQFPWLDGNSYEEIIKTFQRSGKDPETVISVELRDKIIDNATKTYATTFRLSESDVEKTVVDILNTVTSGKPLPTISQIKSFLTTITKKITEGELKDVEGINKVTEKIFEGQGVGYKITEVRQDYREGSGHYLDLTLVVPAEEAFVLKRVYYEDAEFEKMIGTLQGEALTVADVRELPDRLIGQWGFADFTKVADGEGEFVTVSDWKMLEKAELTA